MAPMPYTQCFLTQGVSEAHFFAREERVVEPSLQCRARKRVGIHFWNFQFWYYTDGRCIFLGYPNIRDQEIEAHLGRFIYPSLAKSL